MTLFAFAGLSVAIWCLILSVVVVRFAQTKTHRLWAVFNLVVALWSFGSFLAGVASNPAEAVPRWKFTYMAATFIAVEFYHFTCYFCELRRQFMLIAIYLQGILFALLIGFTNLFISPVIFIFNSIYYHGATPLFIIWLFPFCSITFLTFVELFKNTKRSVDSKRIQALYIFWGMALGWAGGLSTLLPPFRIPMYPFWHLSIWGYMVIMTYAIFKYRLMDIFIVVKRSIVYSILIATISIIYLLLVVLTEKWLQITMGYRSILISVVSAFGLGIILIPLKNRIQNFIDRIFIHGSPSDIAEQNEMLRKEVAHAEKLKAVATLASGLAHEIRNPLTILKTHSEYLPQKIKQTGYLENYTQTVANEIDRINNLVQGLLDFAKPTPLVIQNTDIHKLLNESLALIDNKLKRNHTTLTKNFCHETIVLRIDPNQIKQVFLNLILNAIEAMPNGGKVTIKTQLTKNQRCVQISVVDTGSGIAKQDLPHIFDPFFTKKKNGTGLGLSITHGIIKEHKGTVKVRSEVNKGTTFIIALPITHKEPAHD